MWGRGQHRHISEAPTGIVLITEKRLCVFVCVCVCVCVLLHTYILNIYTIFFNNT
jgi:hypothetical protein